MSLPFSIERLVGDGEASTAGLKPQTSLTSITHLTSQASLTSPAKDLSQCFEDSLAEGKAEAAASDGTGGVGRSGTWEEVLNPHLHSARNHPLFYPFQQQLMAALSGGAGLGVGGLGGGGGKGGSPVGSGSGEASAFSPTAAFPTSFPALDSYYFGSLFRPGGGEWSGGPFRKAKRVRTAFSPGQLLKLEEAFEGNKYVVGNERKTLAQSLSLSETQVKVWFQNRRTKDKRLQSEGQAGQGDGQAEGQGGPDSSPQPADHSALDGALADDSLVPDSSQPTPSQDLATR